MNDPWTDQVKKLTKALEESKNEPTVQYSAEQFHDYLESIRQRRYPIWERAWDKLRFGFHDFVWYV